MCDYDAGSWTPIYWKEPGPPLKNGKRFWIDLPWLNFSSGLLTHPHHKSSTFNEGFESVPSPQLGLLICQSARKMPTRRDVACVAYGYVFYRWQCFSCFRIFSPPTSPLIFSHNIILLFYDPSPISTARLFFTSVHVELLQNEYRASNEILATTEPELGDRSICKIRCIRIQVVCTQDLNIGLQYGRNTIYSLYCHQHESCTTIFIPWEPNPIVT